MRNFTWNRFPIKNFLIDSLLTPIVESTYLNTMKTWTCLHCAWKINQGTGATFYTATKRTYIILLQSAHTFYTATKRTFLCCYKAHIYKYLKIILQKMNKFFFETFKRISS